MISPCRKVRNTTWNSECSWCWCEGGGYNHFQPFHSLEQLHVASFPGSLQRVLLLSCFSVGLMFSQKTSLQWPSRSLSKREQQRQSHTKVCSWNFWSDDVHGCCFCLLNEERRKKKQNSHSITWWREHDAVGVFRYLEQKEILSAGDHENRELYRGLWWNGTKLKNGQTRVAA